MSLEVKAVIVLPPIDWEAYLRKRRDALLHEVRAIEETLHIEPKRRALCPRCGREWNEKAG